VLQFRERSVQLHGRCRELEARGSRGTLVNDSASFRALVDFWNGHLSILTHAIPCDGGMRLVAARFRLRRRQWPCTTPTAASPIPASPVLRGSAHGVPG